MNLSIGQMSHHNDYIVSLSKLTRWLGRIAHSLDIEVLNGFAASEVLWDDEKGARLGRQARRSRTGPRGTPPAELLPR